jgi:Vitamin K-dependent gamma-carboxylase.
MIIDIFDERGLTRLPIRHGDPDACFFPLFYNLPRFSIEYLYMVYLVLLLAAIGIMLGFLYKMSCVAFVVCYWYLFFLDKTVWNNHSYLYGLISIQLFLCNANYYW